MAARLCRVYRCSQRCLRLIYYIIYLCRPHSVCIVYIYLILLLCFQFVCAIDAIIIPRSARNFLAEPSATVAHLHCRYYCIISSTFTFEMIIVSSVLTRVRVPSRVQVVLLRSLHPFRKSYNKYIHMFKYTGI